MSQPSVRAALQKLTRTSNWSAIASRNLPALNVSNPSSPAVAACCLLNSTQSRHFHSSDTRLPSESNNGRKVVSVSSILRQDGLDIQELPILIRLLDKSEVPLTCNHAYAGEGIQRMTVEDENFQHLLQQCASVQEVFKLLEIPSERVTGYSASAALRRMCELQKMNADWDNLHSFIRAAVMKDLIDTVRKDVAQLSSETLFSLVTCHANMESFQQGCTLDIYNEIEKRIVEDQFTLQELCSLSHLLESLGRDNRDLVNSVWVHIGNRFGEAGEEDLTVMLASLPSSHKYLLRVLGKQLHKHWWKMTPEQMVACAASLVRLNSLQVGMMTDLGRWLFLNIHHVSEAGLMQFVASFIHFRFSDANFSTALERYVGARGEHRLDVNLLGLAVEYCRVRRYFSPMILDAAAYHFVQFGQDYSALQMFTVLRPFGQLNYMPKDSHLFLLKTEKMLEKRFVEFHPAHLSELLCSFAFVERVPLNFVQRVLTPFFLSKVKALPNAKEAGLWLEMLQSAVKLDSRGVRIPCLYKMQSSQSWKDEKTQMIQHKLQGTLDTVVGENVARINTFAAKTIYNIDAEIHLTKEGQPIPVIYHGGQPSSQAAIRGSWLAYCMLQQQKSEITSFRGNRFNNLFEANAALHLHHSDITNFFQKYMTSKLNWKQEGILEDCKCNVLDNHVVALGLFFFRMTGPYWRLLGQHLQFLDFYTYVVMMEQFLQRLAILIMAMDHYCVNSRHLLGEFAMRHRHLHKLGYTVVEVIDAEFLPLNKCEKQAYMAEKLKKWVRKTVITST